jgi:hypothetical protein
MSGVGKPTLSHNKEATTSPAPLTRNVAQPRTAHKHQRRRCDDFVVSTRYVAIQAIAANQPNKYSRVKYWEIIADNLSKAGWSWGYVSAMNSNGRTIFFADAHRDDGKRFVVHDDEKLTAFVELQAAIHRQPESSQRPTAKGPRCSTQRAGIAPPHAEGEGLSGVTSDRETFAFICVPAGVVGGVPLTRARNPWAIPTAST